MDIQIVPIVEKFALKIAENALKLTKLQIPYNCAKDDSIMRFAANPTLGSSTPRG